MTSQNIYQNCQNTDDERTPRFYKLYGQLASATAIVNQAFDVKQIEALLNEISALYRLSKGVTRFFRSPAEEKAGGGETMCSYDTGRDGHPVHTVRFVTRLMSISTMTVYMADDEPPLTEDELQKVDLTMRTALAFISRNRLQRIAEEMAFFDDMGFRNSRSFFRYIAWKEGAGSLDGMAAFNYNLRHFSLVNSEHGRPAGDYVLRTHFRMLGDIIGENGIIARLGGDNFIGFCPREKLPMLTAFLTEADIPYNEKGKTAKIRCSAGIFVIPDGMVVQSNDDIVPKIMNACRIAQRGQRGHIVYFDDTLIADRERVIRIQQQFPEALQNEEFHVFFQPKVNTMTGEISGAEALCRWFQNGKIVPPVAFIPVLELNSDICKLDFYMLEHVCRHIRGWLDSGRKAVRVSVNFSRKHSMDEKLLKNIIGIIDRYQIPHGLIEIELTETTTDVEFRVLKRVVSGLQEQQICTSVDDFGMGYSSLNLIRAIPWNVLKIDRSFVPLDSEPENSTCNVMFKHVVALAKDLGLECIAEGVETPAQLEILRRTGCDFAQGYLFDKPLPADEFVKRLDTKYYKA